MSELKAVPLLLVSGFLGAGKTTLLNNFIRRYPERRFGIIVNDFGDLPIDGNMITAGDSAVVKTLNSGQIFCSCMSSSFIDSLSEMRLLEPDFIVVETSGLAKPSPLADIVGAVQSMQPGAFSYLGMLSVVDAGLYRRLSTVLNAVNEQIAFSDIVMLNKADLAGGEELLLVEKMIHELNEGAHIYRSTYAAIPDDFFDVLRERVPRRMISDEYAGWGAGGRPVSLTLRIRPGVPAESLRSFCSSAASLVLRMKGAVRTDDGGLFVDFAGTGFTFRPFEGGCPGITVILKADEGLIRDFKTAAAPLFYIDNQE